MLSPAENFKLRNEIYSPVDGVYVGALQWEVNFLPLVKVTSPKIWDLMYIYLPKLDRTIINFTHTGHPSRLGQSYLRKEAFCIH